MVSYEEAKETALKFNKQLDECHEYEDAYIFSNNKSRKTKFSVYHIVILKENGNAISLSSYNLMPKTKDMGMHEF